jgi:hypothetical protein
VKCLFTLFTFINSSKRIKQCEKYTRRYLSKRPYYCEFETENAVRKCENLTQVSLNYLERLILHTVLFHSRYTFHQTSIFVLQLDTVLSNEIQYNKQRSRLTKNCNPLTNVVLRIVIFHAQLNDYVAFKNINFYFVTCNHEVTKET